MNAIFPFGFPASTAFYLTLYVLTLIIHVVLMNYVLAGSAWLAVGRVRRLANSTLPPSPAGMMLRDWMPFVLGAAITAGVAPLLFVQILYKQSFYTANLLLLHRWMAIVPVLIVAFYVLYLMKTRWVQRRSGVDALTATIAAGCFAFVAYSWTENHLLSLNAGVWPAFYEARRPFYWDAHSLPRLAIWAFGAAPMMATVLVWQLAAAAQSSSAAAFSEHGSSAAPAAGIGGVSASETIRRIARVAIAGLVLAGAGVVCYAAIEPRVRNAATSILAWPYLAIALIGAAVQGWKWFELSRRGEVERSSLALLCAGALALLLGMTVFREAIRLNSLDITALYSQHAAAAQLGGFRVFAIFLLLGVALITLCVRVVTRGTRGESPAGQTASSNS
ncbi:MAG: hypothetical protein U1D55_00795 [Phycisphaerae bacterium]